MESFIRSRNRQLAATIHDTQGPMVIVCHGFRGSQESLTVSETVRALGEAGFSTARFDFNGHGKSQGEFPDFSVSRCMEDLEAVIAHILSTFPGRKIGIAANSLGGMAATLTAAKHPEIQALALQAPVSDFMQTLEKSLTPIGVSLWKKRGSAPTMDPRINQDAFLKYAYVDDGASHDVMDAAAHIQTPVLVVHGSADRLVPVTQSRLLFKAFATPAKLKSLRVFRGGNHEFSPKHLERYVQLVRAFFQKHLKRQPRMRG